MDDEVTLGDIAEIFGGYAFKSSDLGSSGFPVVKIAEIAPPRVNVEACERIPPSKVIGLDRFRLADGDILMAMTGATTGKAGRLRYSEPAYLNQRVAKLKARCGPDFDDYVWALVSQSNFDKLVLANAHGSAQPNVSADGIGRIPIPRLGNDDQVNVGRVVRGLDDKIEHNRRLSRALERLARAIFQAWFVDFEPVKAKAAGARSFPSMPQKVFDTLPTRLVDSEIGETPEGWGVGSVGDAAALSKDQVKPQDHPEEWFEHFSIPAFDEGQNPSIERGEAIKSSKFLLKQNCLLFSKLNPRIPRLWIPQSKAELRQIASTEFLVTLPRNDWSREYLYCQFQQSEFLDDLAQGATGTSNSHQRVKPQDFLRKPIVLPPVPDRNSFQAVVGPMMDLRVALQRESRKLAEVRDYLLPKLLSGAVRVRAGEGV